MSGAMDVDAVDGEVRAGKARGQQKEAGGNLMWIEKHRPEGLEELISHEDIVRTLTKLIAAKKLPHVLFHGPPGTGKTSTILACARAMYGAKQMASMVLELNASDERGIDVVREQIKTFASTRQLFATAGSVKLIVLDEADAMTSAAQMALRRVMEQYSSNARFCIICNYVNKIIPALQSRCTKFRFGPLQAPDVRIRLRAIADSERVALADDGLDALVELGRGDMRRCLNLMQSSHMAFSSAHSLASSGTRFSDGAMIDRRLVHAIAGVPLPDDIERITSCMLNRDFDASCAMMFALKAQNGLSLGDLVTGVHELVLRLQIPQRAKCFVLIKLAEIETRLAAGASERLNVLALIGAFRFAAQIAVDDADLTGANALVS